MGAVAPLFGAIKLLVNNQTAIYEVFKLYRFSLNEILLL